MKTVSSGYSGHLCASPKSGFSGVVLDLHGVVAVVSRRGVVTDTSSSFFFGGSVVPSMKFPKLPE